MFLKDNYEILFLEYNFYNKSNILCLLIKFSDIEINFF